MRMLKAALFASAATLAFATTANAELILKYSLDGGGTFTTVTNQGAGDTSASTATVRADVSVGSLEVTLVGNDFDQTFPYEIHANLLGNNAGGAGTLIFYVTSTDYTPVAASSKIKSTFGASENPGTIDWASYIDLSNAEFGTGIELASVIGETGEGATAGVTEFDTVGFPNADPFSLTQYFSLSWSGVDSMNMVGTAEFVVPEPATLALLGVGLLGMGIARRRKA